MMGCAVLPHLRNIVDCIVHGLQDERTKIRTVLSLWLHWLKQPFRMVSSPLITFSSRFGLVFVSTVGKSLAALLNVTGFILPLTDPEYVSYYTKEVTIILIRKFQTSDEEMKKIVLEVVQQCAVRGDGRCHTSVSGLPQSLLGPSYGARPP